MGKRTLHVGIHANDMFTVQIAQPVMLLCNKKELFYYYKLIFYIRIIMALGQKGIKDQDLLLFPRLRTGDVLFLLDV